MEEKFIPIDRYYKSSPHAPFKHESKLGGSFGVNMIYAEQNGHALSDPPFSQLLFVGVVEAQGNAAMDFGDGWKRHVMHDQRVDLQPANQLCHFRVEKPHKVLVAGIPLKPLVQKLEDVGRELLDAAAQTSLTHHGVAKDYRGLADFLVSNHQLFESGAI
jgi:hypothetical protein